MKLLCLIMILLIVFSFSYGQDIQPYRPFDCYPYRTDDLNLECVDLDGNKWISRNNGETWQNIPSYTYVVQVQWFGIPIYSVEYPYDDYSYSFSPTDFNI
jgi:hypothetical protein